MSYAGREKMAHDLQVSLEIGYFTMTSRLGNILNVQYLINLTKIIRKNIKPSFIKQIYTLVCIEKKVEIYEKYNVLVTTFKSI